MGSPILQEYRKLVNKFLAGTASAAELEQLDNYYQSFDDTGSLSARLSPDDVKSMELRIKSKLDAQLEQPKTARVLFFKQTWFRAAAAILVCAIAAAVLLTRGGSHKPQLTAAVHQGVEPPTNKYLRLKDGSTVILRGKSELKIADNFNEYGRVVTLSGEAYFDIKHDNQRPFIIHTGKFTTTVLGTAFNIKAYSGQKNIIVTVTRGRVKISRDSKVLGILTPGRQLVAGNSTGNKERGAELRFVSAVKETAWVREDMDFDEMPFGVLAKHLGKRYGVQISFKKPELAGCPITGSFDGTESLKTVLNTVSTARGTTYTINGNEVVIDGSGCK